MNESGANPLTGRTILITRTIEQSAEVRRALEERGANVVILPMIEFAPPEDYGPLDAALRGISDFRWLFLTSQNAVRALTDRAEQLGISLPERTRGVRIAAVGPATAEAANRAGLRVTYTALKHQGTSLATELSGEVPGWQVLLPRGDRANPVLPEMLQHMGAQVTEIVAYRTMSVPEAEGVGGSSTDSVTGDIDAVLFFSPSAVEAFVARKGGSEILRAVETMNEGVAIVAIGSTTAAALRSVGVGRPLQAADTTPESVVAVIEEFFSARRKMGAQ